MPICVSVCACVCKSEVGMAQLSLLLSVFFFLAQVSH